MTYKLKTFSEFRAEISIVELAAANGYVHNKRKGYKWPVLTHSYNGDKIIIVNPGSCSNQGYFNPDNETDKGTLIHFIKNRLGTVFPKDNARNDICNINAVLYSFLGTEPERRLTFQKDFLQQPRNVPFSSIGLLPLTDPEYLLGRGISLETLGHELFRGRINNYSIRGFQNIAFPYWNAENKIAGIEVRNKNFKKFVAASNKANAVWYSNIPDKATCIILFESAIDALSYHQLKQPENCLYIAFGGALAQGQIELIRNLRERAGGEGVQLISGVDNDRSGKKYNLKFQTQLCQEKDLIIDAPERKDYNEDLTLADLNNYL